MNRLSPVFSTHRVQRSPTPFRRALRLIVTVTLLMSASPATAAQVTVPVDVGVGPALYHGLGPVFADSPTHYGLKISLAAIINREMIRKHIKRVPKKYRKMALGMREFRYRPSIFVPSSLFISPKLNKTGIYGATWRPIGLSVPLSRGPVVFDVQAGLILTYAFLHSDNAAFQPTNGVMHFFRPGLEIGPRVEIPVVDGFLVSFGWSAQIYVPQIVGGDMFKLPEFDETGLASSLWFVGQAWMKLHFRFPYTTNL